ncbi:hypothetical protein ACJX0J_040687, partial [Zea mays]
MEGGLLKKTVTNEYRGHIAGENLASPLNFAPRYIHSKQRFYYLDALVLIELGSMAAAEGAAERRVGTSVAVVVVVSKEKQRNKMGEKIKGLSNKKDEASSTSKENIAYIESNYLAWAMLMELMKTAF